MSEFAVRVVRVGPVFEMPEVTRLQFTTVDGGYTVCFGRGEYREGDLAVYVSADAVVPKTDPRWSFLGSDNRIRPKKIRGTLCLGLFTTPEPGWVEGQDVAAELGVTKYEPVVSNPDQDERDPGLAPVYDLEGWRKWQGRGVLAPEEDVVVTEKLHGENSRYAWFRDRLWCGSHKNWKFDRPDSAWWKAARRYDLATKLSGLTPVRPLVLFAELLGGVPTMSYGHTNDNRGLAFFDAYDVLGRVFLPWDEFRDLMGHLDLPVVPVLYRGPFSGLDAVALSDGPTTYPGATHTREGLVVKSTIERSTGSLDRVALKLHGETYLLLKRK